MGDRRPLARGQHLEGASGVSSGEPNMTLSPYTELQHDLGEAYKKYKGYAEIIAKGGPLAPQFYDSIFCSEVEKTAARSFGQPRPHMVGGNTQKPIEWTDVLRKMLTPGDFQRQPNGMYRCCVRGSLIEITEANYTEILTGVTDRLLQPLQNLSNEQKETRVRLKLGSDLHQTHHNLVQSSDSDDYVLPTDALGSDSTGSLVHPWLLNINSPDNAIDVDAQSHSSGSDIPWQIKTSDASQSTDTSAENEHEARSHSSKRLRGGSFYNEEWSKTHPARRYSRLEEEEGPGFVKHLVNKGSTTTEVEEEYAQMFGVTRTVGAIFKKFKIKGAWALLKPLREAKKQKTMVPSPHYSTLVEQTLLTTTYSQPSLAMIDTHAHPVGFEPDGLRIQTDEVEGDWRGGIREDGRCYHCCVKGRLVEMSAENYHFIKLRYPQRVIQQEEAAGIVGKQDVSPVSAVMYREFTTILSRFISHLILRNAPRCHGKDIKGSSQAAQEFQAEPGRRRSISRRSDCQPHGKQGFSGWTPILVSHSPVISADDPTKPDFPTHIDERKKLGCGRTVTVRRKWF
ncbi:hypothetical protein N7447_002377 [Penicillium robsamsonii]|uniref:uncharacterized protein n=1 Tax=Penicillium robsamsonii TaxID=1792511 RepID=UPI0025496D4C|nr:uncharacterized protein N7447_002377 [Penicillium robsamsonii]KAJ5836351.1 hypothetical protein N7447_002377 [Penicillium robsamsonii]